MKMEAKPIDAPKPSGLALLRQPFPENQISKLPKPTARQTQLVKEDFKSGIRCALCGAWHHKDVVHLDYVGHAALTDRLLDCDPEWNWEPVAFSADGTPLLDANGGMWIRLTVCGVTRLGYGHADSKRGGDATKEVIGDALRNAAMRFGAALELWHKGQLHVIADELGGEDREREAQEAGSAPAPKPGGPAPTPAPATPVANGKRTLTKHEGEAILQAIAERHDWIELDEYMAELARGPMAFAVHHPKIKVAVAERRAAFDKADPVVLGDVKVPAGGDNPFVSDEIPY